MLQNFTMWLILHVCRLYPHYIQASTKEEAWQKMAIRFPEETHEGFTVTEWEGFNVQIFDVCK